MIIDPADLLTGEGFTTHALGPTALLADWGGTSRSVLLVRQNHAPSRVQLVQAAGEAQEHVTMFVVPRASERVVLAVRSTPGAALATEDGLQVFPNHGVTRTAPAPAKARGRVPWGRYALMRALLIPDQRRTQARLAEQTGISQAAVSMMLAKLGDLVTKTQGSWTPRSPRALWNAFMWEYPGPAGVRTYWYSMRPFNEQVRELKPHVLLSADGAADTIAPWRIPQGLIAYADTPLDMSELGFAPATKSESNAQLVIPADQTIFATAAAWGTEVADPLIAAWDLRAVGGNDADEAIKQLRARTLKGWIS